jgi:acyl-CoA thioesterase
MDVPSFESLFAVTELADAGFAFLPDPFMANVPAGASLENASPHGGLLAVACLKAARAHLGESPPPLRTLTIQFLSAPKFCEIVLRPKTLRAGRSITFMTVEAAQDGKPVHNVALTFGASDGTVGHRPDDFPRVPPPAHPGRAPAHPGIPRHAALIEQVPAGGGTIMGSGEEAMYRFWRRMSDLQPLTEERLVFMIDAMAPPLHAVADRIHRSASADLRYDFAVPLTPDLTPDGWALFEYRARDWSGGWTIDECSVWNREGRLLALGRQQRKMLAERA